MSRVAKALLYDPDGYALVLERSGTHPLYAHEADLPGGLVEKGESFTVGLVREAMEEAGITITEDDLTLVQSERGFDDRHLYEAHLQSRPPVTISWEHAGYKWVAPDELAGSLESRDHYMRFVRNYVAKRG